MYLRIFYWAKLGTRVIRTLLCVLRGIAISQSRKFQGYCTLGTSKFVTLGSELKAKELGARTQHSINDRLDRSRACAADTHIPAPLSSLTPIDPRTLTITHVYEFCGYLQATFQY
jgi:hypothetical protein